MIRSTEYGFRLESVRASLRISRGSVHESRLGDRSRGFDDGSGFGHSGAGFGISAVAAGAGAGHDGATGGVNAGSVAIGTGVGASAARTTGAGAEAGTKAAVGTWIHCGNSVGRACFGVISSASG